MKQIGAGKFRAQCLKIIDEVAATREPVAITKNGRPIVKLVPAQVEFPDFLGCLAGTIDITGDIESPVASLSDWDDC